MNLPIFIPNTMLPSDSLDRFALSAMIADGFVLQQLLNNVTTPVIGGLVVTPTSPASLGVLVGSGICTSFEPASPSGLGSNATVLTDSVTKIGINTASTPLTLVPPTTAGQSACYLIEVKFDETPTNSRVLTYKNPTTGATMQGPNGSNTADATQLSQIVSVAVKVGTAANTGSQTVPVPDTGWSGVAYVTLHQGQTTIQTTDITLYPGAPQIANLLVYQSQLSQFLNSSALANAYVAKSQLSLSATPSSVVERDTSGGITAAAFNGQATSAATATHASQADSATNATTAGTATYATSAGTAGSATTAVTANSASYAGTAGTATSAATASNALLLNNYVQDVNPSASTIALRDGSGQINANEFVGTATKSLAADFAELFLPSEPVQPGHVVQFGGDADFILATAATGAWSVVSTAPGYLCDNGLEGGVPIVANGKVPVMVSGFAFKGQYLIPSDIPGVAIATSDSFYREDAFGKVLEDDENIGVRLVKAFVQGRI